jgi:EAL domain-containing protein (putative c-di-GMP-specific phosphodiesterase class I)
MSANDDTGGNAEWFPRQNHNAGEFIFLAGEGGDAAYIIEAGEVEILGGRYGSSSRLAVLGAGELFGELAALDRLPRSGSARALTPVTLIRIEAGCLNGLLEGTDPVIQYMFRSLMNRLRRRSDYSGILAHPAATSHLRPGGRLHAKMLRTLTVISDLSHAIEHQELELNYQPVMQLNSGAIAGFEALLRWKPSSLGQIAPDEFVEIAERSGLIHQLGAWVLHQATQEWTELRTCCPPQQSRETTPFLSLNFSAPELSRIGLADILEWCIIERNIPPEELNLEMTERQIPVQQRQMRQGSSLEETMQQIRDMGVSLALDDMGTGHAGFHTLQNLPFSAIKIDKAFIQKIITCERSLQIVRAMLSLAQALGLNTTAEGVEDEATHQKLRELGCTYAQGFYYARPMRKNDAMAWARGHWGYWQHRNDPEVASPVIDPARLEAALYWISNHRESETPTATPLAS